MPKRIRQRLTPARRSAWACLLGVGTWLFAGGCITEARGLVQRELEVLLRPEANPLLIRDSFLVDWLGPEIIKLFS